MSAMVEIDWDPDRCACRWGEQPCDRCLPVLDARLRRRALADTIRKMAAR